MYQLRLYAENEWFSTVTIWGTYGSDYNIVRQVEREIKSNVAYFQAPITWALYHGNADVTNWYVQTLGEYILAQNERR